MEKTHILRFEEFSGSNVCEGIVNKIKAKFVDCGEKYKKIQQFIEWLNEQNGGEMQCVVLNGGIDAVITYGKGYGDNELIGGSAEKTKEIHFDTICGRGTGYPVNYIRKSDGVRCSIWDLGDEVILDVYDKIKNKEYRTYDFKSSYAY